jgi:CBS domain-containing protein
MEIVGLAKKVSIYISESDKWQGKVLYIAILEMLREEKCAGATATRALSGFGAHSRIRTVHLVSLSADLPVVVEWVDNPARVKRVMPRLREMVIEGLITVYDVEVITYSHRQLRQIPTALPVYHIMQHEVQTVRPDTPLVEVAELFLMNKSHYKTLPVVDAAKHVVGILTDGVLYHKAKLLSASTQQQLTSSEITKILQELRESGQTVADFMTPNPITVATDMTITQAVTLMVERNVKRLPVVDMDHRLMGIISRLDVLRALSQPPVEERPRETPPPGQYHKVKEIMTTNIPTVQMSTPLEEVVDFLVSNARRRVVVIDNEKRVVGIITDGDLIKHATITERAGIIQSLSRRLLLMEQDGIKLSQRIAKDVMVTPVVTVMPETLLLEALNLLLEYKIKRLPVVDTHGRLMGLIGRGSILQILSQDLKK